jgi:hypothetical protein
VVLGAGAALGLAAGAMGLFQRATEEELRGLSIPDDFLSLGLVVLFLVGAVWALARPASVSLFYLLSIPMLVYAPFGKIKHCIFFFFSRFQYGENLGRLGILEHRAGE